MVRFPAVAAAAFVASVLNVSAFAQPSSPSPTLAPIETSAASPPATTLAEVQQQPVYKTSWDQYQALKAKAHPPKPGNWSGVWANALGSAFAWEPGFPFMKFPIQSSAPLKPEYRQRMDRLYANYLGGMDYDTLSDCIPPGWPRMLV
jgi:hypothetical protein